MSNGTWRRFTRALLLTGKTNGHTHPMGIRSAWRNATAASYVGRGNHRCPDGVVAGGSQSLVPLAFAVTRYVKRCASMIIRSWRPLLMASMPSWASTSTAAGVRRPR